MVKVEREEITEKAGIAEKSSPVSTSVYSRRRFISESARWLGIGSLFTTSLMPALAKSSDADKAKELAVKELVGRFKFKGKVLKGGDADFAEAATGKLWNRLLPDRRPEMIAQVTCDQDVIAALKYARENNLKVTVRGGGHNWCSPSLREGGMLIDLTALNRVLSIDVAGKRAVVEPIVTNREVQKQLNAKGMAFASGHCPEVKLSGYLLSGGMSWNQSVWGAGVSNVEAIELVTADGELITASAVENKDYFWAARGAGPGFFGVALRYHLKLHPLPPAITCSSYLYPYQDLTAICDWLTELAPRLAANVELGLFVIDAPEEHRTQCSESNGKVCLVAATCFADSAAEAKAALSPLDTCPVREQAFDATLYAPQTFEQLFDASGKLWPPDLRCKVDALFSNEPLGTVFGAVKDHLLQWKSEHNVFMFTVFTGADAPANNPVDSAFRIPGKLYGGPWTMWKEAGKDTENIAWHEKCVELLKPTICGHYISETDTMGHPDYVKGSYNAANYDKLARLRAKYDKNGLFFVT